jgi:hypothetical protein
MASINATNAKMPLRSKDRAPLPQPSLSTIIIIIYYRYIAGILKKIWNFDMLIVK